MIKGALEVWLKTWTLRWRVILENSSGPDLVTPTLETGKLPDKSERCCARRGRKDLKNDCKSESVSRFSGIWRFVTLWTIASQASLFRQECGVGCQFPSPGHLPDPRIKPGSPASQVDSLLSEPAGKPEKNNGTHPNVAGFDGRKRPWAEEQGSLWKLEWLSVDNQQGNGDLSPMTARN